MSGSLSILEYLRELWPALVPAAVFGFVLGALLARWWHSRCDRCDDLSDAELFGARCRKPFARGALSARGRIHDGEAR